MAFTLIGVRFTAARVAGRLRLRRLADWIRPPSTPWWLQRPLPYLEHFTGGEEPPQAVVEPLPVDDDVMLAYGRWMDDGKRAKLIEVAFTEPDPVKAGLAAAELRHMNFRGRR